MATGKSAGAGGARAAASMRPDQMSKGGLPDDFEGVVREVRLTAWDYDGNLNYHTLAARVTIDPNEDSDVKGPVVQHYSAGDLKFFAPSLDGKTPVDLSQGDGKSGEWDGYFAVPIGKRDQ